MTPPSLPLAQLSTLDPAQRAQLLEQVAQRRRQQDLLFALLEDPEAEVSRIRDAWVAVLGGDSAVSGPSLARMQAMTPLALGRVADLIFGEVLRTGATPEARRRAVSLLALATGSRRDVELFARATGRAQVSAPAFLAHTIPVVVAQLSGYDLEVAVNRLLGAPETRNQVAAAVRRSGSEEAVAVLERSMLCPRHSAALTAQSAEGIQELPARQSSSPAADREHLLEATGPSAALRRLLDAALAPATSVPATPAPGQRAVRAVSSGRKPRA